MKEIIVIFGGRVYERDDVLGAVNDIQKELNMRADSVQLLDISMEKERNKIRFLNKNIKIVIVDPYYEEKGETKDIRFDLDENNLRYNCSELTAANICADKQLSKEFFKRCGILVPAAVVIPQEFSEFWVDGVIRLLGLPLIIKPLNEGNGIGIYMCEKKEDILFCYKKLKGHYKNIILEQYLNGIDITVGVHTKGGKVISLEPIELELMDDKLYDNKAKSHPERVMRHIPARISTIIRKRLMEDSQNLYMKIGCKGFARIDYRLCNTKIYGLEINAAPALGKDEHIARCYKYEGKTYEDFLDDLLEE